MYPPPQPPSESGQPPYGAGAWPPPAPQQMPPPGQQPGVSGAWPNQPPGASQPWGSAPLAPTPYPLMGTGQLQPPPPQLATGFDIRTLLTTLGIVLLAGILFFTMPGAVAAGVRGAYPTVRAVISGASDGTNVQQGQTITFSAAQSTGKDLTYNWTFDDGSSATTPTVTKIFSEAAQDYHVSLSVSDPLSSLPGHSANTSIDLHVLPPPPVASFVAQVDSYGYLSVDASASQGAIQTYLWDFGDGSTDQSYGATDYHYYSANGTYTVKLTVQDSYGRADTTTRRVSW